ncbi:MAG: methyl-accepting chemotaxis protein [Rhodocyclaceae bacterium]|nr:methyl-accepting chemotaxis protein [Rhodocyclaceae bacterium]
MTLRSRLRILSVITAMGLGLILILTTTGMRSVDDKENSAHRRETYVADLIEIKASALSTIMLDPTLQETKDVFGAAEKNIAAHGKAARAAMQHDDPGNQLEAILAQWASYDSESQDLIALAMKDVKAANDRLVPLYSKSFKPFQAALENFVAARQADAERSKADAESASTRTFWTIVALLVVVMTINVGAVFFLSASLQSKLKTIGDQLRSLQGGDLTRRLTTHGADEIDEIADGVNRFVDALQGIVHRTRDRSNQLASAALQLSTTSANAMQGAHTQSDAASSVAASIEQLSVSIDQVSDSATEAEKKASLSGDLSREGVAQTDSAIAEIKRIESIVTDGVSRMQTLDEQAKNISTITNVIKEVADQTNLLALNAAIEAARAGEQGRGFAVVADEVRKLAERTTTSASEISNMVTSVQASTAEATNIMRQGSELVRNGVGEIERAGSAMRQISESSASVVNAISDISRALREQRASGAEIAKNVEGIAQSTDRRRAAAVELADSSRQLGSLAGELQAEVATFKT